MIEMELYKQILTFILFCSFNHACAGHVDLISDIQLKSSMGCLKVFKDFSQFL